MFRVFTDCFPFVRQEPELSCSFLCLSVSGSSKGQGLGVWGFGLGLQICVCGQELKCLGFRVESFGNRGTHNSIASVGTLDL